MFEHQNSRCETGVVILIKTPEYEVYNDSHRTFLRFKSMCLKLQ